MATRRNEALWLLVPTGQRASGEWIDDTLRDRVQEAGLTAKVPLAAQFPRQRVEVLRHGDPIGEVNRLYYRRGWTDGLPIIPPTLGRVEEMLSCTDRNAQESLGALDPLKGEATVEKVAANAVMAGCRPEYLPVVLAAVEALAERDFNLRGVQTTDENVTPLLILNGPLTQALEVNSSFGALGPGWQANATIGRAVRLVMNNLGGGWPHVVAFAGIGQPGRYTLCLAENEAESPWAPLHVDQGFAPEDSTVTVLRAESAINVTGALGEIASVMASSASAFARVHNGKVGVALAPYVANTLAGEGWSKADVQQHLYEHSNQPDTDFRASWLYGGIIAEADWPKWVLDAAAAGAVPAVRAPEDITIFVAGGDIPIPQHVYFPSWGFPPCRITKRVAPPPAGVAHPA